jgi:hypothetical protein
MAMLNSMKAYEAAVQKRVCAFHLNDDRMLKVFRQVAGIAPGPNRRLGRRWVQS